MKRFIAGTAVVVAIAGSAQALDVRLDLGASAGATAGNWNNISDFDVTTNNLIDYPSGANTGASISFNGPWGHFVGDEFSQFADADWVVQPCTQDGAGLQTGQTGTIEVSGLADGLYRVEVVSARTFFEYLNFITVGASNADRTYNATPVNTPWNSVDDGLTPSNWLIWDDVAPVGGSITIQDVASADTLAIINAVRIYQIPAPGAAAVLGLGGLTAIRRRR